MDKKQEIAKRLKTLRQWKGMKQAELAQQMEFSQAYMSDLESGKKPIPLETLLEIIEILDVDLGYFDLRKPPVLPKHRNF